MFCLCKSYNDPQPYQTVESVILDVPEWVGSEKKTVCVDACIAPAIEALWEAKVWTLGCCCGHNGTAPRSVIVDRSDRAAAQSLLAAAGFDLPVFAWELIGPDGAPMQAERDAPIADNARLRERGPIDWRDGPPTDDLKDGRDVLIEWRYVYFGDKDPTEGVCVTYWHGSGWYDVNESIITRHCPMTS